jgi:hypothetical protein
MKSFFARIGSICAVITDWLLIAAGGLLIFKALISVDVPMARYLIVTVGILFVGAGFWYRHRRKQRCR